MKWFNDPETLEDLKKQYKRLAMEHHPDRGGSTEAMQQINAEYESLFACLKDIHKTAAVLDLYEITLLSNTPWICFPESQF